MEGENEFSDCEKKRWTYSKRSRRSDWSRSDCGFFLGEWEDAPACVTAFKNCDDLWRDGGRASFGSGRRVRGGERDGQSADIRDARKAAATTFRAFQEVHIR